jgi:hypothetical protein
MAVMLSDAGGRLWTSICQAQDRILTTSNGLAGDSAMEYTLDAFRLNGDDATRARLASKGAYRAALKSRAMVRQALGTTITHTGPLIATWLGLDNRQLLPPFSTNYRNSDGVFGHVLFRCVPHGYAAQLPFVLRHLPSDARPNPPGTVATSIRSAEVLRACLATWSGAPPEFSIPARMRGLGRHLVELTTLSDADFVEFLRIPLSKRIAETIAAYDSLLARYRPIPRDPWRRDIIAAVRRLQEALSDSMWGMPVDIRKDYPLDVVLTKTRQLIRRYGRLLYWWPVIVEKNICLTRNNHMIATTIDD